MLDISRSLVYFDFMLLHIEDFVHVTGSRPLAKDISNFAEHTLQPMDGLSHQTVDTVVVVHIQLFEALDLEGVEIVVDGDQIE